MTVSTFPGRICPLLQQTLSLGTELGSTDTTIALVICLVVVHLGNALYFYNLCPGAFFLILFSTFKNTLFVQESSFYISIISNLNVDSPSLLFYIFVAFLCHLTTIRARKREKYTTGGWSSFKRQSKPGFKQRIGHKNPFFPTATRLYNQSMAFSFI